MIRYKFVDIPSGSNENLTNALAGLGERDRTIHAVWIAYNQGTTTVDVSQRIRAYKETDQIMDFPISALTGTTVSAVASNPGIPWRIPLNLQLKAGEGFQVGNYDAGVTTSVFDICIEYEEK